MKTKTARIFYILLLSTPLLTSGCFSGMVAMGGGWSGPVSKSAMASAAAADIITAPVQAPFIAYAVIEDQNNKAKYKSQREKAQFDAKENQSLMRLLEDDPTIAYRERWDLKDSHHKNVFQGSFSNPNVKYTPELIEKIYKAIPSMRAYEFTSIACSSEFLAQHFDEAYQQAIHVNYEPLAWMVQNPNTPIELVEKVASSKTLPGGAVHPAKRSLKKRQTSQIKKLLESPTTNSIYKKD
jgi:hypothetical protein